MASFLHAPRQAIDKLNKEVVIEMCQMSIESTLQVAEEERRAGLIKEELVMLRAVLPKMATSMGRSKRAAKSDGMNGENIPLCSDTSPSLLGPLLVDQSPTTMDKVDFGRLHWNSHLITGREGASMGWHWGQIGSKQLHSSSDCRLHPPIQVSV